MNKKQNASVQALFIDWLTLYGVRTQDDGCPVGYTEVDSVKSSMWWRRIVPIMRRVDNRALPIGVMCSLPTSPIMGQDTISIKFDNALLYRPDYWQLIMHFLTSWHISCVSVARLDVACDFLRCASGLSGAQLLDGLLHGRILRRGSRKMSVHGRAAAKITPSGDVKRCAGGWDTITFGTHASVAQWQLYNKTEELRQSSLGGYCPKEYIRDAWKKAGVYSPTEDTWRCEIRLSSKAQTLINTTTGELMPVSLTSLMPSSLSATICAIFAKWSCLYAPRTGSVFEDTHISTMRRIFVVDSWDSVIALPRVMPSRDHLPASSYIKGMMTSIEKFRSNYAHLLCDHVDNYILGDAINIVKCIYSQARSDERRREAEEIRRRGCFDLASLLEFRPQLTDEEMHYFSWLRIVHKANRMGKDITRTSADVGGCAPPQAGPPCAPAGGVG